MRQATDGPEERGYALALAGSRPGYGRDELRCAGQVVLLEPKAFKEYGLRNCLMKIRHALGDARMPAPERRTPHRLLEPL